MPRKARNYRPNSTCHIYLSANNDGNCFYDPDDYKHYLRLLNRALILNEVALHAYVLLNNHIQLLLTPTSIDGISKLMQSVSSSYVRYFNKKYLSSGSLFKGRYKACAVEADKFLLSCMRYIEEQPIRSNQATSIDANSDTGAGISASTSADDYLWSSYVCNAKSFNNITGATVNKSVSVNKHVISLKPHQQYLALGSNVFNRQQHYQQLFSSPRKHGLNEFIRERLIYNFPIASQAFIDQLEQHFAIEFSKIKPGRPKKQKRLRIPIFYC